MGDDKKRMIMLVCSHCGHHDINGDELLEIDFKKEQMMYVCRVCNKENVMKMKTAPSSYPRIGIR